VAVRPVRSTGRAAAAAEHTVETPSLLSEAKTMKRADLNTLILPGFVELIRLPSGAQKIAVKDQLRVSQVAAMLKCDPSTVRGMCEDGTLDAWRLTDRPRSCYVIGRASVEAYLARRGLVLPK